MRMGGSSHRKLVVHNGAYAIFDSLSRQGISCVFVAEMAAHLLGHGAVPTRIKVAIISPTKELLSEGMAEGLLLNERSATFCVRHRKDATRVLSYFDPVVQPPKKTWCDVELLAVRNPPPAEYTVEHIMYIDGLPVGSMIPLVIDKLRALLLAYRTSNGHLTQSDIRYKRVKKLISKSSLNINWVVGHESLREEALRYLAEVAITFPELSSQVAYLVDDCRMASVMAQNAGSPVWPPDTPLPLSVKNNNSEPQPQGSYTAALSAKPFSVITNGLQTSTCRKAARDSFRTEVLCLIAKRVVEAVRETGAECALFGSLACYLYGNTRPPNDIDLVAFPANMTEGSTDVEQLKRDIADRDPSHFRLEAPKDPTATFRVLYYVVDKALAPVNTFHKNKCKIDVLVPGLLHLPFLSSSHIKHFSSLPVVPFPLLLLQKLQGWDDHRRMEEHYKFQKHVTDAEDVQALLKLEHVVSLRFARPWDNRVLFNEVFLELSMQRVVEFCGIHYESAVEWARLGFATSY